MDVIVYHNPRCGTSRNTLGLIRNSGIEPHVIEYLKTFPWRVMLRQFAARIGVPLLALLRDKEPILRIGSSGQNSLRGRLARCSRSASYPPQPADRGYAEGGGTLPAFRTCDRPFAAAARRVF
jgi:hypothetical protein